MLDVRSNTPTTMGSVDYVDPEVQVGRLPARSALRTPFLGMDVPVFRDCRARLDQCIQKGLLCRDQQERWAANIGTFKFAQWQGDAALALRMRQHVARRGDKHST